MTVSRSKDAGHTWEMICKEVPQDPADYVACFSSDGGLTWDAEHELVLKKENIFDMGYPSTCILKDGKMLTVYYGREEAYAADGKTELKNKLRATKWILPPRLQAGN